MHRSTKSALLLLAWLIFATSSQSILLKTHDYPFEFGKVAGLNYPEYIHMQQNSNSTFTMMIYNMTSLQQTREPIVFARSFPSSCQFALETVDYGYYTKFPFYRVIGECTNQTHTQVYNIRVYRSGDFIVQQGNIVQKSADELGCELGPIRVQYFYSSIGIADTFVYRFCAKKQNTTQTLYKQFTADTRSSYIFKQEAIEKIVGLTNLSLTDMQPAIGIDGRYNLYVSQNYGLIYNGGSKFSQYVWKPAEKVYKVEKLCWSNTFAILVEGFIYFSRADLTSFYQIRKTDKINIDTTSKCTFFTIGHYAVCSIYNQTANVTTWYIYSEDANKIRTNITEVINGKFTPYLAEDLCATNSFYIRNSRYQFYLPSQIRMPSTKVDGDVLGFKKLGTNGKPITFLDTANILLASLTPLNSTYQLLYLTAYNKVSYDGNALFQAYHYVSVNASKFKLTDLDPYTSLIYVDRVNNLGKTSCIFYRNYASSPYYSLYSNQSMDIEHSQLGYFKYDGNLSNYQLIVKTPLETNAYGRYSISSKQLRYPYEFEAEGYKVCSLVTYNYQILFYKVNSNQIPVVVRAGLRNLNYLALDDIKQLSSYSYFNVECGYYGLILYSKNSGKVVTLNGDLQVISSLSIEFEEIKFTRNLVIVKNGAFVEVRSQATGDLIGIYKWEMSDLLTNVNSAGFINTKQSVYYEFGNSAMEPATQTNWKHANLKVQ